VEDVGLFLEALEAAAVRPRREKVLHGPRVPRVSSLAPDDLDDVFEELLLLGRGVLPRIDLATIAVFDRVEKSDRRAPAALPRDDPLAPVLDHPRAPLLAAGR